MIEIKANSNLLIEEQEKVGSVTRSLRLLLGKMLFTTEKESKTKTILQTPTAVAGLRGTAGTLSVGLDGQARLHFIEGGVSYTVGDFIFGLAEDVPQELADLNPAQRAAFAAAAAAELARKAAEDLLLGKISDPQAALAAARAAEAAALEAKAAAEAMLRNADPAIVKAAQAAIEAAHKALEEARKAKEEAIKRGAKVGRSGDLYPCPGSGSARPAADNLIGGGLDHDSTTDDDERSPFHYDHHSCHDQRSRTDDERSPFHYDHHSCHDQRSRTDNERGPSGKQLRAWLPEHGYTGSGIWQ